MAATWSRKFSTKHGYVKKSIQQPKINKLFKPVRKFFSFLFCCITIDLTLDIKNERFLSSLCVAGIKWMNYHSLNFSLPLSLFYSKLKLNLSIVWMSMSKDFIDELLFIFLNDNKIFFYIQFFLIASFEILVNFLHRDFRIIWIF